MEERRRHQRFYTSIPIKYRVQAPENPEVCWLGCGVLKNVSLRGIYFISTDTPPLEPDQIRDFTILSDETQHDFSKIVYIGAKSRIVRIIKVSSLWGTVGIALEFLSGPVIGDYPNQ